ncbi:hypothetical protein RhiirC2_869903 [Rhizophagus irregularis]|uniref:Ricin B lectin domain-containing protein n=1 Tax=Rhizophagus irregularis TaxID=588596 RepID=A0A2N1MN87_9GLOM|nr:hypothetical protein RhiirC2_869903 [Rhizophagus irregularis]
MKVIYKNNSLHYLGFFFFFIISTYCSLIPNDWVITHDPKDFDLIEGITYNIVHSISKKYLVSVGDHVQVGASDDSNSYQHWSLRKAEGKNYDVYNIINIGTGTNLDNDGKGVYASSLDHDSITNPYQHWIFIKIKDNTYNIVNTINEHGNIDSNGKIVYIGKSSKNNRYQQWLFEPINYKLITKVKDFVLDFENGKLQRKFVNLLSSNDTIKNPTNATIEQAFEKDATKSNSYTLEIRKSESLKVSGYISMSFEISLDIFDIFDILPVKAGVSVGAGIKGEIKETTEETYKKTVTDTVIYRIKHKATVPPYTSVQVIAIANKVNYMVPFHAKIQITCKADRLNTDGKAIQMIDVDANAIRYYAQRENPGVEIMNENFFYIITNGTLKIDGYGYNSYTYAKNLPQDTLPPKPESTPKVPDSTPKVPESTPKTSESSPKNLVMFHQIILTLLQIMIMLQYTYQ